MDLEEVMGLQELQLRCRISKVVWLAWGAALLGMGNESHILGMGLM